MGEFSFGGGSGPEKTQVEIVEAALGTVIQVAAGVNREGISREVLRLRALRGK